MQQEPRVLCFGCVCEPGAYPREPFEVGHGGKRQRNVPGAPAPIGAIQRLKYHNQAAGESRPSKGSQRLSKMQMQTLANKQKAPAPSMLLQLPDWGRGRLGTRGIRAP